MVDPPTSADDFEEKRVKSQFGSVPPYFPRLDALIRDALAEDLAGGDLTTDACVAPDARWSARAVAKAEIVVCGGSVFQRVFHLVDPLLVVEVVVADGAQAKPGDLIWRASGAARSLLYGERTALNFAQRMSGTATLTRAFVDALPEGSTARITDTRKTTPSMRALERYAVRAGGGFNHRDSLGSAVMIKDNHVTAAGGISAAVSRARRHAPHTARVEVEVESIDQLNEAIAAGADIIMLDDFTDAEVTEAVERIGACSTRPILEVSGGLDLERVRKLAGMGIDVFSVGALTHSAKAADISLLFEATGESE